MQDLFRNFVDYIFNNNSVYYILASNNGTIGCINNKTNDPIYIISF